jgi:ubiquinone biosynthesis O-methyltransferase
MRNFTKKFLPLVRKGVLSNLERNSNNLFNSSRLVFNFKTNNKNFSSSNSNSNSLHVDHEDDKFFNRIKDWWDPNGSMYTLHYYNDLRIKYIRRELNREGVIFAKGKNIEHEAKPFSGLKFLDIGCGAGLLCESLGRLGANVVGIDSNSNSYEIASGHLEQYEGKEADYMRSKIKYFLGSIDNYKMEKSEDKIEQFDVVTAMEVIEHVNSPKLFIEDMSYFVKPGGYLIISTINKTQLSYLTAILLGEKLTGVIPEGTHDWNKFIPPEELMLILNQTGYEVRNISGVSYNPLTSVMNLTTNTQVNYILIAKKI